jgi:hypothetical protein
MICGWSTPITPEGSRRRQVQEHVVLAGRATSMPFTAATTGPEQIATDNTTADVTCAAHAVPR